MPLLLLTDKIAQRLVVFYLFEGAAHVGDTAMDRADSNRGPPASNSSVDTCVKWLQ